MKIVVFDLDETLGYFVEFGIFWDSLSLYVSKYWNKELNQDNFNTIIELYPEFLRPNIIPILNYLKSNKHRKSCDKVMIYTNNQGSQKWCNHIISYFENKIAFKLFDQIIAAFKINGKQIELCRTTNNKTHSDLIRCTKLPIDAEIFYLDDTFFPEMANENVYYINIKPYIYDLPFNEMHKRFLESNNSISNLINTTKSKNEYIEFMNKNIRLYNFKTVDKNKDEYDIDKILSKKIMHYLDDFFEPKTISVKPKTRKRNYNKPKNKSVRNKIS
jgi:hypothetical protein